MRQLLMGILIGSALTGFAGVGRAAVQFEPKASAPQTDEVGEKIWLNGIDCPENGQAFGKRAKQLASQLAFGQEVTVKTFGPDEYGRTIGDVRLPDGRNLNQELVSEGMCWWYRKYARNNAVLEKLEADADPVCGGQHQIVPPFSSGR